MKIQVPLISRPWKIAVVLLLAGSTTAIAQDRLALRGATIIPIVGERIVGGTILISDGRIEAVGKDIEIPVEAKVIDATGRFIMPGMINVHSAAGMSQANEQNANVPFLSVVDSIDPIADFFEESRRNGVTTAAVVPGNSTMIGGRAAIVKTAGSYVNDMLVKRDAGIKISLAPTTGTSRMSHFARLRRELLKAQKPEEETSIEKPAEEVKPEGEPAEAPKPEGGETPETPGATPAPSAQAETEKATREALVSLLKGEMPAIIYCETSMDVSQALALVDEFKLKPILVLGRDCYKAAKLVADRKLPVVLDSTMVYWRTDPITRKEEKIVLPKIFSDAGASYVFQVADSGTSLGTHYYWYQATTAVRYGMSADAALKALTFDSAKLLGIDDSVGSIETGKDADLVILSGEPLSVSTWVETTIVGGKVVYQKSEDAELRLLFNPEEDTN
ncbi:MAG: amidohydrolase family protein [Planctomyces sp.]|nr:amidohydrolase family protein [Planctomyces sp.]